MGEEEIDRGEEEEEEEERPSLNYASRLEETVRAVLGGFAASLVGVDGITLAGFSIEEGYDSSLADAHVASIVGIGDAISGDIELGDVQEMILTASKATIVVRTIGEGFYVCLVLKGPHQNLGLARVELRRLCQEFAKTLYTE